ncbi:MAG TPA: VOC family protein [Caldimonas sp.]|jgi:2,3-dihydroxy-p-cumate/2,3-dihydroxybenzoate 3,4-dioxygenase|nr:VOC family protein [Caldimonas sp.]HEX2540358.1 VOC family protein [Caldimonas sp.]
MIRFNRLGYVALNVADPDRSVAFYRDQVGLQVVDGPAADVRYLRCSDKHHDIALYRGVPGLKRIGFELESEAEFAPLETALRAAGRPCLPIPGEDCRAMGIGPGLRTSEPVTGATLDFYALMQPSQAPPFAPTVAKILRLGHLVLKSTDFDASVRFFTDVLNFRISDSIDKTVTFLRCWPSPYHHSLGIGQGRGKSGLHHVALMVHDADDIGRGYWRLQREEIPVVHGPGRHLPSGSMFLYFLDPDGLTIEYTFGMEEFPEEAAREPRLLPPVPESNDIWASKLDPRKSAVGEIERTL